MKIKLLTFVMLIILPGFGAMAQETISMTVQDACKYALEHNLTLKNSHLATDKSTQAVWEAISNGLPQIDATVDYTNSLGADISITFTEGMPATVIPIKPSSNFYLNFTQLIFSGNYWVGIQTARLANDLSTLNIRKTEIDIQTQVIETYYLVQISSKIKTILEKNVENLNGLYVKTAQMADAGIIEQTSVDQLRIQVNSLKNAVASSERQLELAKNLFRLQLGLDLETQFTLTESAESLLLRANDPSILQNQLSLASNIDFKMLDKQGEITGKMLNMKYASYLPTVAGFYRYTGKILKPDFDMTPSNTLGIQVSIPIFSSGMRMSQVNQAKIDLQSFQNTKELVSDQLLMQEKQLKFNYSSAMESFNNQKENIEVSRKVYDNLRFKFEQGMISGLDMINADNNYLKAETDYLSAMLEVLRTDLQLKKLYGTIQ
ncbi:MAG: TolC family protein [Bacteroidales bacterium]|nr:TolC family protein [Bacteroidales bacterium]